MPVHRHRVYLECGSSRKARIEGWLSLSIFVSAAILLLSLIVCLPDVVSWTLGWLLPERLSAQLLVRLGVTSVTERSVLVVPCEILMTFSGAYLVLALFIKSHAR